jgi:hypothetical protein
MSPGKALRPRRGGGWVVWGGDALCCASPSSCCCARFPQPPRATQASSLRIHSAPAPTKVTLRLQKTYPCKAGVADVVGGDASVPTPLNSTPAPTGIEPLLSQNCLMYG